MSDGVNVIDHSDDFFRPDPVTGNSEDSYDADAQYDIYGRKRPKDAPRPLLEMGRPIYKEGPLTPHYTLLGEKNPLAPALAIYGDLRTAVAFNDDGDTEIGQVAARLNLDVDLKLTGTERLHAFFRPLDRGGQFTRYEFSGDDGRVEDSLLNLNIENMYFEGDVGSIATGITGEEVKFDLPFAAGFVPIFLQNGLWVDDAFIGGGVSLTAMNSPTLDISNMDVTVFGGFDEVTTPGVLARDGAQETDTGIAGITGFADVFRGYAEVGYGHVFDRGDFGDQDYDSLTAAFTKRYGSWLSNSVRGFYTFGQDRDSGQQHTAEGFALLVENSLITSLPSTLVPYFNGFVGIGKPQPLANAEGLLVNTGINFETDGMTGFPKLDDSANDMIGGAIGIEYLFNLDQQIIFEVAAQHPLGGDIKPGRGARGEQYAIGLRYQLPIADAWILRSDAMIGFLENADDVSGVRFEVRRKF
ncbi:MAG: hypothetical protein ACPGOV_15880 [Magnetovibrionaceae bacterium]